MFVCFLLLFSTFFTVFFMQHSINATPPTKLSMPFIYIDRVSTNNYSRTNKKKRERIIILNCRREKNATIRCMAFGNSRSLTQTRRQRTNNTVCQIIAYKSHIDFYLLVYYKLKFAICFCFPHTIAIRGDSKTTIHTCILYYRQVVLTQHFRLHDICLCVCFFCFIACLSFSASISSCYFW